MRNKKRNNYKITNVRSLPWSPYFRSSVQMNEYRVSPRESSRLLFYNCCAFYYALFLFMIITAVITAIIPQVLYGVSVLFYNHLRYPRGYRISAIFFILIQGLSRVQVFQGFYGVQGLQGL